MTIVNAFTTVKPETEATVRAVDYLVVGAAPEQFRVYSDDERDVARWRRVETPESPWTPDHQPQPRPYRRHQQVVQRQRLVAHVDVALQARVDPVPGS